MVGQLGEFIDLNTRLAHASLVNEALRKAADDLPFGGYVASQGLTDDGGKIHFDAKSLREFGFRYSSVYKTIAREGGVELIAEKPHAVP